jgi:hypothetical protein
MGQHTARIAASIGFERGGIRRPPEPALEKDAGNPVADAEPRDALAHGDHFAGAVRQRNTPAIGVVRPVSVVEHIEITMVQRHGFDTDQHLAGAGHGFRDFLERETVAARGGFELVLTDRFPVPGKQRL